MNSPRDSPHQSHSRGLVSMGLSGIFSRSNGNANPGDISITTGTLSLTDGAVVKNGDPVLGPQGASVTIHASDSVHVTTGSAISSQASFQDGGPLVITTPTLSMNQGLINTSTVGVGKAGDVEITAQALTLDHSSISAATEGSGGGGSITVNVGTFMAQGNSQITSSSTETATGNAGNITIHSASTFVMENSKVTTEASQASGGQIKITAPEMVRLTNSRNQYVRGGK